MKRFGFRQVVALVLCGFALLFAIVGEDLGFMDPVHGPGPGFFPIIMSVVMLVTSLICLVQSFGETKKVLFTKEEASVIVSGVMILVLTFIIGLIPACAVFILVWTRVLNHEPWKNTLIVLVISMGIAFGVFQEWLGVEFPLGIFDSF